MKVGTTYDKCNNMDEFNFLQCGLTVKDMELQTMR